MGDWVVAMLGRMGVVGVFLLTMLETVFPPIPSEFIMPLAGYLASRGEMGVVAAVAAGTLGSGTGALVLYAIGRKVGEERLKAFADRHGRWLTLSRHDIDRASGWFSRHGAWAVFGCRLVPGLRSLISLPAGIDRMPLPTFLACTLLGSAAWTGLLVGLGYVLGSRFEQVAEWIDPAAKATLAAIVAWYAWRVIRHRGSKHRASP